MEAKLLEVFAEDVNYAIIKAPGRNYPGCLIQGDSLSILCRTVREIANQAKTAGISDQDLLGNIEDLNNALIGRLLHYQQVLTEHGIKLPYARQFSKCDLIKLVPSDDSGNDLEINLAGH
jgi:hypothetical protein